MHFFYFNHYPIFAWDLRAIYWRFWLPEIETKIDVDFDGLAIGIELLNFKEIHENGGGIYSVLVVKMFIVEALCTWGFVDAFLCRNHKGYTIMEKLPTKKSQHIYYKKNKRWAAIGERSSHMHAKH